MKQIKRVLMNNVHPFEGPVMNAAYELVFEWANKAGREGRTVGTLQLETLEDTSVNICCTEVVTDDDYAKLVAHMKSQEEQKEEKVLEKNEPEPLGEYTESCDVTDEKPEEVKC